MSKGPWKRCLMTGLTRALIARADDSYLNAQGGFDTATLPDCNLFNVRSIAVAAGFDDPRYFVGHVLPNTASNFHVHTTTVSDPEGHYLAKVVATHTNSALAGGLIWHARIREEARARAVRAISTDVASGAAVRKGRSAVVGDRPPRGE